MSTLNDKEFLAFIRERLVRVHHENENVDYIRRLTQIVESMHTGFNIGRTAKEERAEAKRAARRERLEEVETEPETKGLDQSDVFKALDSVRAVMGTASKVTIKQSHRVGTAFKTDEIVIERDLIEPKKPDAPARQASSPGVHEIRLSGYNDLYPCLEVLLHANQNEGDTVVLPAVEPSDYSEIRVMGKPKTEIKVGWVADGTPYTTQNPSWRKNRPDHTDLEGDKEQ
jgi:hypothetical protein